MSHTTIPPIVKLALVGRAGGRCQYRGCNKRLDTDDLTQVLGKFSHFAHIVADRPKGPRGDTVLSQKLAGDISNIMLLCFNCHRRIDVEEKDQHSAELLREMKRDHEDRIQNLLEIQTATKAKLLIVKANIGGREVGVSWEEARRAVLPDYPLPGPLPVDLTKSALRDHEERFWDHNADEIVRQVEVHLRPGLDVGTPTNLAVFALAPIPLLMVLGKAVGDINSVQVFQKFRSPDTWAWQSSPLAPNHGFHLDRGLPEGSKHVALVLNVSGTIHDDEVASTVTNEAFSMWTIRATAPQPDFVRTRDQLSVFRGLFRQALTDIRQVHGHDCQVHLFPAVPNSVAIECGRVLLPKADPAIRVYDKGKAGWRFALNLLETPAPRD